MSKIFKGWQATIFIQGIPIGCCKNVTVDYDSPIEPYYEIENPNMVHFDSSEDHLGLVTISGTITRAWINTYYLKLLFGGAVPIIPNAEFDMVLKASDESGAPMLYLYQCRFTKGTINIPANGWLEESYDFIAMRAGTSEVSVCPIGDQIINGDFETGIFSPWEHYQAEVVSWLSHSGTYCCWLEYNHCSGNVGWIKQTFLDPIRTECISELSFWVYTWSYPGAYIYLKIYYSDGSNAEFSRYTLQDAWTKVDFTSDLEVGKKVSAIEIYPGHSNACVDDVVCIC